MKKWAPVGLLAVAMALVVYALLAMGDSALPNREAPPPPGLCVLTGVVLDVDGTPLPDARVSAVILEPGDAYRSDALTDRAGRFTARLFPARGDWEIRADPEDGPSILLEQPVTASRDGHVEVTLRRKAAAPEAEPRVEPNLAGEVSDSLGRVQIGIPVVAMDPTGRILERVVSDENGAFEMRVEAEAPVEVRIEGAYSGVVVDPLPHLGILLFREERDDERGDLTIEAKFLESFDNEIVTIELHGSSGTLAKTLRVDLVDRSWVAANVAHGAYDVRVRGKTASGVIQGFEFTPLNYRAVVPVGRGGAVAGTLSQDARVVLVSDSPTRVPLTAECANTFGFQEVFRGVFADSGRVTMRSKEALARFSEMRGEVELPPTDGLDRERGFRLVGIPAGAFTLRAFRTGYETVEIPLEVHFGEQIDLGVIELPVATGSVSIEVTDREESGREDSGREESGLEFPYRVSIYSHTSGRIQRRVGPGRGRTASFPAVAAGLWFYRVERVLGAGHTRHTGRDRSFTVKRGEETRIRVDCTWRF